MLDPQYAHQETTSLRQVFTAKRNLMVGRLKEMGIRCVPEPEGTFYCWADVSKLPRPLNQGETFFREALTRKVLTVPGTFFDINPGKRRRGASPLLTWVRFSFGPPEGNVREGLNRLGEMIGHG